MLPLNSEVNSDWLILERLGMIDVEVFEFDCLDKTEGVVAQN